MFGSMIMAATVHEAFGAQAATFAGAYVAIQVGRSLVLTLALRGDREQQRIPARILCWSAVSAVAWIGGVIAPQGMTRLGLWTVALAVDHLGLILGWPTPGLGRARMADWAIAGEHLAERYRQFIIIALGESILLTGMSFSREGFAADRTTPFVAAFVTTVLLWRIYGAAASSTRCSAGCPGPG